MLIKCVKLFYFFYIYMFLSYNPDLLLEQVHPDARQFTLAARGTPTTVEQLEQQLMTPPVVATTCLSIDQ